MHDTYKEVMRQLETLENWNTESHMKNMKQDELDRMAKLRQTKRQYDLISGRWMLDYYRQSGRYATFKFRWVLKQVDTEHHNFDDEGEMFQLYSEAKDLQINYCRDADVLRTDGEP